MIRNQHPSKLLKKKRKSLMHRLKQKQQLMEKQPLQSITNGKKVIPIKNNHLFSRRSSSWWKLATFLGFISLIIILVIPTLIVAPFVEDGKQAETLEKELESTKELANSPFSIEVMRNKTNTVEDIPLENYIAGVIASEMPADFELEALKAQALAARTYTVNQLLHGNTEEYDVTDTVQHQVYRSEEELLLEWGSEYTEKMNKIYQAVQETSGQILTYEDNPITAAYFSTSNGFTENSEDYWENEVPYLRSVESAWDKESPEFLSQVTFTIEEVGTALGIELPSDTALFMEEARTESGRVKEFGIEGYTFSGREIRDKLNLKSSDFTVKQNNNHLVFTTEGYGHGVGMSQYGANFMAEEGKTYEEILQHYYQGVEINTINEAVPTLVSN